MHHQNIVRLRHAYFVDDQRGGEKSKSPSKKKDAGADAQGKDKKNKKGKKGGKEEE